MGRPRSGEEKSKVLVYAPPKVARAMRKMAVGERRSTSSEWVVAAERHLREQATMRQEMVAAS